jgi:copper chaperone NosL
MTRSTFRTTAGRVRCAAALLLGACAAPGPRPIAYDRDVCAFCSMTVSDPRYGAELITVKGKVHTFDSIECLASYYLTSRATTRSLWVTDAGRLVPAERARFRRAAPDAEGNSPMGLGLSAAAGGTLGWADVLAMVEREGLPAPGEQTP